MCHLTFAPPSGATISNPTLTVLKRIFLRPHKDYWRLGSGSATLSYTHKKGVTKLLILPNEKYGFYLQYKDERRQVWLSLRNRARLAEVADICDGLHASIGLFVPRTRAWLAVEEFCKTGQRTSRIEWIQPSEIPEPGNW